MPSDSYVYYFKREMIIWCFPPTLNSVLSVNSSEYKSKNASAMEIGGKFNKTNRTICSYCKAKYITSNWKCYHMICKFICVIF